jgi:hypothetical protein
VNDGYEGADARIDGMSDAESGAREDAGAGSASREVDTGGAVGDIDAWR